MFTHGDWYKELSYQNVLKEAIITGTLPFHVPLLEGLFVRVGDRFLGVPAWNMSPQILLLLFLDSFSFSVINLMLLYSVGFLGCQLLKNHYRLGFLPFTVLFFLFNFNGYHITKETTGGPYNGGYYLIPFAFYIMLRVAEADIWNPRIQNRWGVYLGLVLSGMLFQGSLHLYVECVTFIVFWGLTNSKQRRVAFVSCCVTFITGAIRLLPAAVTFGGEANRAGQSWAGYSPSILVQALVVDYSPSTSPLGAGWPEFSMFISLFGLVFLLYFGMWGPFMRLDWVRLDGRHMALPIVVLFLFSAWHIKKYTLVMDLIPLLNAERVVSRYIIYPILAVLVIAVINFQGFLAKYHRVRRIQIAMWGSVSLLAGSILRHGLNWRMHRYLNEALEYPTKKLDGPVDLIPLQIQNNGEDSLYLLSFWAGLAITCAGFLAVVVWLRRLRTGEKNTEISCA